MYAFTSASVYVRVCVCNPWSHNHPVGFDFGFLVQGAPGVLMRPVLTKTLISHL